MLYSERRAKEQSAKRRFVSLQMAKRHLKNQPSITTIPGDGPWPKLTNDDLDAIQADEDVDADLFIYGVRAGDEANPVVVIYANSVEALWETILAFHRSLLTDATNVDEVQEVIAVTANLKKSLEQDHGITLVGDLRQ